MATPRNTLGHPHQQAGVCTTSILKCTKTPPTRTVGLGKRVRFSEGSSPEPTRQRGGREEKVLSRGSDRKRRKTKTAPGTGEEKDSEPLTGVERREEGKSDEDEELEEDEYEVEAILDHRKLKHELEYLIKWRGYPDSENTWVPLSLMSCQDLLQEYDGRRQQMQPSTQGRRDGNGKLAPTNSKRSTEAKVTEKAPQQPVEPKEPGDKEELKKKEDQEKDEKETEYEVKAILDHRKREGHKMEYLVQWKSRLKKNSWLRPNQIAWGTLHHYLKNKVFKQSTMTNGPNPVQSTGPKGNITTQRPPVVNRTEDLRKVATVPEAPLPANKSQKPEPSRMKLNGVTVAANLPRRPTVVDGPNPSSAIVYIDHCVLDSPPPSPLNPDTSPVQLAPSPRLLPLRSRLTSFQRPPLHPVTSWSPLPIISPVRGLNQSPSSDGFSTPPTTASSPNLLLSPLNGFHLTIDPDTEEEQSPILSPVSPLSPVVVIDCPPNTTPPSTLPPPMKPPNGVLRLKPLPKPSPGSRPSCEVPLPKTNGFKRPTLSPGGLKKLEGLLKEKLASSERLKDKVVSGLTVRVEQRLQVNEVIWLSDGVIYRSPLSPHNASAVEKRVMSCRTNGENIEAWTLSRLRKRSRSASPPNLNASVTAVNKRRCSPRLKGPASNQPAPSRAKQRQVSNHKVSPLAASQQGKQQTGSKLHPSPSQQAKQQVVSKFHPSPSQQGKQKMVSKSHPSSSQQAKQQVVSKFHPSPSQQGTQQMVSKFHPSSSQQGKRRKVSKFSRSPSQQNKQVYNLSPSPSGATGQQRTVPNGQPSSLVSLLQGKQQTGFNHQSSPPVVPPQQEALPLPSTGPSPSQSSVPLPASNQERYQDQLMEWQYLLNKERRGLEEIILVENTVDQAPIPTDFHYITSNIYSKGVPDPSNDNSTLTGCACYLLHKKCGPKAGHCCPHQAGAEFPYTLAGKVKLLPGKPIYECNRSCSCRPDCNNRVVQHGRQLPLCIFRTSNNRGWGVKTLEAIKPNTFVAEYVGEVITTEEAERRGRQYDREGATYLFDLDFNDDPAFTIDAAKYGNISHFFNHSCDPNLVVYSVWVDTLDPRLPRIAFFTTRNVSAGEELTFDYQMNHNLNTTRKITGQVPCLCGSPNCIGFLD